MYWGSFLLLRGFQRCCFGPAESTVFCCASAGFRWCLAAAIAEELRFRLVQARLRRVFGLCTGALFFFVGGSKGAVLDPPNVLFFAVPKLGFRWCLAVSHPLPNELRFRLVEARLRHVFGLCTGALFFFLGGSKGAVLDPPNVLFFCCA